MRIKKQPLAGFILTAEMFALVGTIAMHPMACHGKSLTKSNTEVMTRNEVKNLIKEASKWNSIFESEKALECETKALALQPQNYDVYLMRASTNAAMGNKEAALADYEKVLKFGDAKLRNDVLVNRASFQFLSGRYKESLNDLNCLGEHLSDGQLTLKGRCLMKLGKPSQAISQFSLALKQKPGRQSLLIERADAYFLDGKYQKAIDDYSSVIEANKAKGQEGIFGALPSWYTNRATAYEKLGKPMLAKQDRIMSAKMNRENFENAPFRINKAQPRIK